MTKKNFLILFFIILLISGGIIIFNKKTNWKKSFSPLGDLSVITDKNLALEEDGAKVALDELLQGCSLPDCISSIDNPNFENVSQADGWLEDSDRVFILTFNDQTKIYPQRIMNWHEIVNDWYESDRNNPIAVAVTFCPLCGTATAFERKVDGTVTEFGVSGKLHNSDLVMYDRLEGSLWQQITGEAIVGPAARRDELLDPLPIFALNWKQAKVKFPEALVLSRETGHSRNYDRYPYGTYEEDDQIYFSVNNSDERLHPKAWVHGIVVDGQAKAYDEEVLLGQKSLNDTINDTPILIENDQGQISFINQITSEDIVPLRSFWFAWATFHPETQLYSL